MTDAYVCDRCGTATRTEHGQRAKVVPKMTYQIEGDRSYESVHEAEVPDCHLCPGCAESFKSWVEGRVKMESPADLDEMDEIYSEVKG